MTQLPCGCEVSALEGSAALKAGVCSKCGSSFTPSSHSTSSFMMTSRGAPGAASAPLPATDSVALRLAKIKDVPKLCEKLSGSLRSSTVSLHGRVIYMRPPDFTTRMAVLLSRRSASTTSLWRKHPIWPVQAPVSIASVSGGLFSLDSAPKGAVICAVSGGGTKIEGGSLILGAGSCIVFDAKCSDVKLSGVTIEGGSIICHGPSCNVTFQDVDFEGCTLVATHGAQVTITGCAFYHSIDDPAGISILASGSSTCVKVSGCSITGGAQGFAVAEGARVDASNVQMRQIFVTGSEVRGERSTLSLTDATLTDFSTECTHRAAVHGVLVQNEGSAKLSRVMVQRVQWGVCVERGSSAQLTKCDVRNTSLSGYVAWGAAAIEMHACSASRAEATGIHIYGAGTKGSLSDCKAVDCKKSGLCVNETADVVASECEFKGNGGGAVVYGAVMKLENCASEGNNLKGYWANAQGRLTVSDCRSAGDRGVACGGDACMIVCTNVEVRDAAGDAFACSGGGKGIFRNCSVSGAGGFGMNFVGLGTQAQVTECSMSACRKDAVCVHDSAEAEADQCILDDNGGRAAFVYDNGVFKMASCSSRGNGKGGYWAESKGAMHMTECSSTFDGHDGGRAVGGGVACGANGATIEVENMKVRSCGSDGFLFRRANATVRNCTVDRAGEIADSVDGIYGGEIDVQSCGVRVCGSGSQAKLVSCTITECKQNGIRVFDQAEAEVDGCSFARNGGNGAFVCDGASMKLRTCESEMNGKAGYWAEAHGRAVLTDCSSTNEGAAGCGATEGGMVEGERVSVRDCGTNGYWCWGGGQAVLKECSTERHRECGFLSYGKGSKMHLQGCASAAPAAFKAMSGGRIEKHGCSPET